jgi:hypothetical protein
VAPLQQLFNYRSTTVSTTISSILPLLKIPYLSPMPPHPAYNEPAGSRRDRSSTHLSYKYLAPDFETLLVVGEKEDHEKSARFYTTRLGLDYTTIPAMGRSIRPAADL